ncbi:MAG TPA: quinolinate synthase NadA [Halanaerobiales bacterium]|nr:quinolinate synthase NadA [Halanaerobiales bacterium]
MKKNLVKEIKKLKKEQKAVILAHYYQLPESQEIADFTGDSFALSRKAADTDAEIIVFCGVKFMAESAAILSPDKTVLLPEQMAGCPLAEMASVDELKKLKEEYPEATVVSYVNSTAAVKAESDVCCTSSNALKIVRSIKNNQVLFVPDKNLGNYVAERVDKEIIIWDGYCATHHRVKAEEVRKAKKLHPEAPILAHPECRKEVLELADFIGSTSQILEYAHNSKAESLIIGTEEGILHELKKDNPDKKFYILSPHLICPDMKKTSLQKIYNSLKNMETIVRVPEGIRKRANRALTRMLELSG